MPILSSFQNRSSLSLSSTNKLLSVALASWLHFSTCVANSKVLCSACTGTTLVGPDKTHPSFVWMAVGPKTISNAQHKCLRVCVCHNEKKSARRMASTTSDTGDTSSKQQQAQRKENYNKIKRPVSSVDHCHPYRRKGEEKHYHFPSLSTSTLFCQRRRFVCWC